MMATRFRIFLLVSIVCACLSALAVAQEPALAPTANYAAHLSHVLLADLHSDNAPEIIGLDDNSNSLVVMLNRGDGTYGPPHYYGVDIQANGVAIGDFNGDGKLDVAVALGVPNDTKGYVAVLLNAGHGELSKPVYYKVPVPANSIAVGDFNHDNLPDIAIVGNEDNNAKNTVVILTNTGSSFTQQSFPAPTYFSSDFNQPQSDAVTDLVAGDFNGDNRMDLAYLDRCSVCDVSQEKVFLLVNTSSGWQQKILPMDFRVLTGTFQMTAADIDGDGRTDLLTPYYGCYTPCIGVDVIYMDKDLTAPTRVGLPPGNFGDEPVIEEVAVGDFNNDGLADIVGFGVGASDLTYNSLPPGIIMWTASDKRAFNDPQYYPQTAQGPGYGALFTVAGFIDKDGKRDLVVPWGEDLQVWTNSTNNPADPCPYPSSGGVHVCAPAADVPSGTVHFVASARTNTQPLQRFELWVDGRKRWVLTTDRLDVKLAIPGGVHNAEFIETGASGLHIDKRIEFKVGN